MHRTSPAKVMLAPSTPVAQQAVDLRARLTQICIYA